jgi:uncharacterized protein (DUF1330 family)
MGAYLIVDIADIHDETTYAAYRERVSPGLLKAGGRYMARGGPVDVLEGDWRPGRIVVVHFDSGEAARRWWASAEYTELKQMRQASTRTNMILVEGLAAPPEATSAD